MDFHIIDKYYSKEDKLFHVIKEDTDDNSFFRDREETCHSTFEEFYNAVNKNLAGANLLEYDFKDCNLNNYNFKNAILPSKVMIKLGTYGSQYFDNFCKDKYLAEYTPSTSLELITSRQMLQYNEYLGEDDEFLICYISDLHLNHKLFDKFSKCVNEYEIKAYLRSVVKSLKAGIEDFKENKNILFVGDISFNFEILKLFFKIYKEEFVYATTFFILGNHELWDKSLNQKCETIEKIVAEYRKFFKANNIILLENQLYFPNSKKYLHNKPEILTEEKILKLSKERLREQFTYNGFAIFGGLGYAGLNNKFNYNNGIYRDAPLTRQEEIERSKRVELIHRRLKEVVPDKKIYFVTHMPKKDWSNDDYVKDWIYISGHTHKNYYCEDDNKNVYEDNQIGYKNDKFCFKYLISSRSFDFFCDYKDGIYEITRNQYKLFNYGFGIRIDFNREFNKLYMLKRNGAYCFLIQIKPNADLKLLNGGNIKNIGNHDLNYFYENLSNYTTSIKNFLKSYEDYQKQIAREIRKIGGSGSIHGCIIDIDSLNHLYVNPCDAKITPYFAFSITDKYVYTNLISLLKAKNENLYINYVKLLEDTKNQNSLILLNNDLKENLKSKFVGSTEIYRVSKIIKSLQYTTKYNIVRLWNDTISCNNTTESGKLIVSGIINPGKMTVVQKKSITNKEKEIVLTKEEKKATYFKNYADKVSNKSNNTIKVISYISCKCKAKFECLKCGHIWTRRADHYLERANGRCPNCKK